MQILYSCFRYTGRLFLGCAVFVDCCNIIRTSWEIKKERLNYRKMYIEECVRDTTFWLHVLLSVSFYCFLPLLSPPSQVKHLRNGRYKVHNIAWVVFCVMILWVNGQKYENLWFNTIRFFISNVFFQLSLSVA